MAHLANGIRLDTMVTERIQEYRQTSDNHTFYCYCRSLDVQFEAEGLRLEDWMKIYDGISDERIEYILDRTGQRSRSKLHSSCLLVITAGNHWQDYTSIHHLQEFFLQHFFLNVACTLIHPCDPILENSK